MRMNQKITLLLVATGFTLGGCELMQPQGEDPVLVKLEALERRMQALERVVQNQSLANLTQDVAAAQRQGDELQGRLETLVQHEHNRGPAATAVRRPRCPHPAAGGERQGGQPDRQQCDRAGPVTDAERFGPG